jgi:hypothetical protein
MKIRLSKENTMRCLLVAIIEVREVSIAYRKRRVMLCNLAQADHKVTFLSFVSMNPE